MSTPWTHSEDAYLASNFATAPMQAMIAATGRSMHAIYCRAKVLGLKRPNRGCFKKGAPAIGKRFAEGNKPWNRKDDKPATLRSKIIDVLTNETEVTIHRLHIATGSRKTACWNVCASLRKAGNIHVARYQEVMNAPGNFEAVYRIGAGVDAVKPENRVPAKDEDIYAPQPIPRPALGLWGLVWNTTNAGQVPAERNSAP